MQPNNDNHGDEEPEIDHTTGAGCSIIIVVLMILFVVVSVLFGVLG